MLRRTDEADEERVDRRSLIRPGAVHATVDIDLDAIRRGVRAGHRDVDCDVRRADRLPPDEISDGGYRGTREGLRRARGIPVRGGLEHQFLGTGEGTRIGRSLRLATRDMPDAGVDHPSGIHEDRHQGQGNLYRDCPALIATPDEQGPLRDEQREHGDDANSSIPCLALLFVTW